MNKIFDLSKKNIIVTGSNRGNGLAIAKGLIEAGAKVIRIDKTFNTNLNSDDYQFDLSKISEIPNLISNLSKRYNKIFGLVNNAGITVSTNNPYKDYKAYEETLNVNLYSVFVLSSEICPIMAKNKSGSIINITSLGAHLGFEGNPSYQISKSGVRQLTKSLARDWGKSGIRVNNICPGGLKGHVAGKSKFQNRQFIKNYENKVPLKRLGEPEEVANVITFIASDASSYITGSNILVDGGWTII